MAEKRAKFTSLFGGDFYLAQDDARRYFREPFVMIFFGLCALIIVVYREGIHYRYVEEIISPNLLMPIEFLTALAVLTFLNVVFFVLALLQKRGIITTVFLPLVTLPAACFIQLATATAVWSISSEWPEHLISFEELSQDAIVILAMEAMFALYVVPVSETFTRKRRGGASKRKNAPDSAASNNDDLTDARPVMPEAVVTTDTPPMPDAAGPRDKASASVAAEPAPEEREAIPVFVNTTRSLSARDFEYVRSKGHYLHFIKGANETKVRGNMRSIHNQLGTYYGIQINRSVWVSFLFVDKIANDEGKCVVRLTSGHEEIVASARKLAVTMAYADFKSKNSTAEDDTPIS